MVLLENKSDEHKVTIENNEDSTMNEEKPKLKDAEMSSENKSISDFRDDNKVNDEGQQKGDITNKEDVEVATQIEPEKEKFENTPQQTSIKRRIQLFQ